MFLSVENRSSVCYKEKFFWSYYLSFFVNYYAMKNNFVNYYAIKNNTYSAQFKFTRKEWKFYIIYFNIKRIFNMLNSCLHTYQYIYSHI